MRERERERAGDACTSCFVVVVVVFFCFFFFVFFFGGGGGVGGGGAVNRKDHDDIVLPFSTCIVFKLVAACLCLASVYFNFIRPAAWACRVDHKMPDFSVVLCERSWLFRCTDGCSQNLSY